MTTSPPSAAFYDASYYGHTDTPTANYRNYQEPGWSWPLAAWLVEHTGGPWLDAGCAFGHLVRDLTTLRHGAAVGVEWSDYAVSRTVAPPGTMFQWDVRDLSRVFGDGTFRTVVSMDLLEHFAPAETERVIGELTRVCLPFGYQVHLVGWPMAGRYTNHSHAADPTHRNFEQIGWYRRAFAARGWKLDRPLTIALNTHRRWRRTDWRGRWQVYRKGG